jgi:hypothetical protein
MHMLEEGTKTQEDIQRDLSIPRSTFYAWKRKINYLKSEDGQEIVQQAKKRPIFVKPLVESMKPELGSILLFEEISIIRDYKNHCRINKSPDYTPNIFKICNLTQKDPHEFSSSLDNAKSIYLDFEAKWVQMFENVTTENYRKGARSFLKFMGVNIPARDKVITSATDSKGDYARVFLTLPEVQKVANIVGKEAGHEYKTIFCLHHEIFARPTTMHGWVPNIEVKTIDVDGKTYEFGEADVFEKKQNKHYSKVILDPVALRFAKAYNKKIINDPISVYEKKYASALKSAYADIGKIDPNITYEKGQEGWLYFNRPIYSIRHSAAVHWLYRTAFDASMVARMGWEKVDTLSQFYARSTVTDMMMKGSCYYCNPPKTLEDMPVFCSPMHALVWLNGGRKN